MMSDRERELALRAVLGNPRAAAQALAKHRAEMRLIDYTRLVWKVTDPANPLRVGWAMEAICEHLEAVSNGHVRNLLINVPPGFSKSLCTDTFWPTWEWGPRNRADLRVISWSYAERLVKINANNCRKIIRHPLYQALWGDRVKLSKDQDEKLYYENTRGGFGLFSTVKGSGTGLRGDRLILDDPHSVDGADSDADREGTVSWFGGTLTTRVRNANPHRELVEGVMVEPSATVIIMQRVNRRDVAGTILDELPGQFEHLLIEMEHEGVDHPARRTVGWRGSSIGYQDPRAAEIAAIERAIAASHAAFRAPLGVPRRAATFRRAEYVSAMSSEWQGFCEGWATLAAAVWWSDFADAWGRIALDMAHLADPVRFSRPVVEAHKQRMRLKHGSNAVASQFRQWPHEGTGTYFKREWLTGAQMIDLRDVPAAARDDVRGWDLAASETTTSDQTACVKLRMDARGRIYVMHALAVRKSPGGVEDFIRATASVDGKAVVQSFPQDPGAAGKMVIAQLARVVLQGYRFRSSPEAKGKEKRAEPLSAQAEHGNVYVVRGDWNGPFVDELVEFPHGAHDDFVDAASRAYDALISGARNDTAPPAPKLFASTPY